MKDRIKRVRSELGLNQSEFGKKISISRSAVWKIENGENTPSEQTLKLICNEFGISYTWLTEGTGSMYSELDKDSMAKINDIMIGENEFAKNLFREFAKLDDSEWKTLEKLIKNIAKEIE